MNDVLNDALSNLEHDNYGLDYQGYKDRQADIALIRAALAAQPAAAPTPPAQTEPSDEEIISLAYDCNALPEVITDESLKLFSRALLARYGQAPAASTEPFAVLTVHKHGAMSVLADGQSLREKPITDEDRKFWREQRGCEIVEVFRAPVAAQAPQESDEPLPAPGIHAVGHYAGWLRREAHRHQEPKASVLRQTARMLDVLQAECARLHQELIDAQAPAANGDARDAARYRWLRDPCSGAERVIFYCRGDYGRGLMSGSMLDAAIDAAMQRTSDGGAA